jgi:acyltransferase
MEPAARRVGFIDAARTLAMALMVQGHVCDNLLSPAGKASFFYKNYLTVRGVTGPLFFFVSGFAFVVASDPAWREYGRPGPRLWGRLRRVAALFAVGWFLQIPRWSGPAFTHDEWRYIFRTGVLHAIAGSLLVALALIALSRSTRVFALACGLLAAAAVTIAPIASHATSMPVALGLLVRTQEGSLFPLIPWAAHFLLGAAVARLYVDLGWSPRKLAASVGALGSILLVAGTIWQALVPVDVNLLSVWVSDPAVFLSRAGLAWCVFSGFTLALGRVASRPWLKAIASHALSVYVVHLVALYGFPGTDGLVQRIGPTLGLGRTFLTGPLLFASCTAFVVAFSALWGFAGRGLRAGVSKLRFGERAQG